MTTTRPLPDIGQRVQYQPPTDVPGLDTASIVGTVTGYVTHKQQFPCHPATIDTSVVVKLDHTLELRHPDGQLVVSLSSMLMAPDYLARI